MTAEPDVTPRVGRAPAPDLDEEREIDFGRLGRTVAKRWWLVLAAVAVGAVIGYLGSLGGGDAYVARTTVYLGQPLSPTGNAQIQSLATNPSTVSEIVRSDEVVRKVAQDVGVKPGALRRSIATRQIVAAGTTAASRANTNPLVQISVRGPWKGDTTARAANALADETVTRVSEYVDVKAKALQERLDGENRELASLDAKIDRLNQIAAGGGPTADSSLILASLSEQRRGQLVEDKTDTETLLTLARNVERGKQVTVAQASRVPAQSSKSSIIVGGLIGLIAGLALALLWDPVARRRRGA
jgi:capsular polysaccharide biosynthesis protein